MAVVRARVLAEHGVDLEPEVEIWAAPKAHPGPERG